MLEGPEGLWEYRLKIDRKLLSLSVFSPDTNRGNNLITLILTAQSDKKSKDDNDIFSLGNPLEES